jgi:hypothetical protein
LNCQSRPGSLGPSGTNEWREFVKETSTAKFYAIGFCVLSVGTVVGFVTSLVFGSEEFRIKELGASEWRIFGALQAEAMVDRTQAVADKMISSKCHGAAPMLVF